MPTHPLPTRRSGSVAASAFTVSDEAFATYPADVWNGAPGQLDWHPDDTPDLDPYVATRVYTDFGRYDDEAPISVIRESYAEFVNNPRWRFAGHYMFKTTGCGTACASGILFDLTTGKAVATMPVSFAGYEFRRDSKLLVINPFDAEANSDRAMFNGVDSTLLFLWDGTKFVSLSEFVWPDPNIDASKSDAPVPTSRPASD